MARFQYFFFFFFKKKKGEQRTVENVKCHLLKMARSRYIAILIESFNGLEIKSFKGLELVCSLKHWTKNVRNVRHTAH